MSERRYLKREKERKTKKEVITSVDKLIVMQLLLIN